MQPLPVAVRKVGFLHRGLPPASPYNACSKASVHGPAGRGVGGENGFVGHGFKWFLWFGLGVVIRFAW